MSKVREDGLPVVNMDAVLADPQTSDATQRGARFEARLGGVGRALGAKKLSATVTVVPPGKCAWPKHYHFANDEMIIVLQGEGTLHYGDKSGPIAQGDVAYIEAGTATPFQVENTSAAELRYLVIDPQIHPDVFVYPDSGKIGFVAGGAPLREQSGPTPKLTRFITDDMKAGYWDGEVDE